MGETKSPQFQEQFQRSVLPLSCRFRSLELRTSHSTGAHPSGWVLCKSQQKLAPVDKADCGLPPRRRRRRRLGAHLERQARPVLLVVNGAKHRRQRIRIEPPVISLTGPEALHSAVQVDDAIDHHMRHVHAQRPHLSREGLRQRLQAKLGDGEGGEVCRAALRGGGAGEEDCSLGSRGSAAALACVQIEGAPFRAPPSSWPLLARRRNRPGSRRASSAPAPRLRSLR